MTEEEMDHQNKLREQTVRRICEIMGWNYKTSPIFTGLRKVAQAEAVSISLDKLNEICDRLQPSGSLNSKQMDSIADQTSM